MFVIIVFFLLNLYFRR